MGDANVMKYKLYTEEILRSLRVKKSYKGYKYIISCIEYISKNEYTYTPVTKYLYVDVAHKYKTNKNSVEKSLRYIIETIWNDEENRSLIAKIFGEHNQNHRPTNTEFLAILYDYIKYSSEYCISKDNNYGLICPLTGKMCEIYKNTFLLNK